MYLFGLFFSVPKEPVLPEAVLERSEYFYFHLLCVLVSLDVSNNVRHCTLETQEINVTTLK